MMVVKNDTYLFCVKCVARVFGITDALDYVLDYIDKYGCKTGEHFGDEWVYDKNLTRCVLAPNYKADLSFTIIVFSRQEDGGYKESGILGCFYRRKQQDWTIHNGDDFQQFQRGRNQAS